MTPQQLTQFFDLSDWPAEWTADEDPAKTQCARLIPLFTAFLQSLADRGLAINTLRRHRNSLKTLGYVVGRELMDWADIHEVNEVADPFTVLLDNLDEYEGPLHPEYDRGATDADQVQLDATCKQLYAFCQVALKPRGKLGAVQPRQGAVNVYG